MRKFVFALSLFVSGFAMAEIVQEPWKILNRDEAIAVFKKNPWCHVQSISDGSLHTWAFVRGEQIFETANSGRFIYQFIYPPVYPSTEWTRGEVQDDGIWSFDDKGILTIKYPKEPWIQPAIQPIESRTYIYEREQGRKEFQWRLSGWETDHSSAAAQYDCTPYLP